MQQEFSFLNNRIKLTMTIYDYSFTIDGNQYNADWYAGYVDFDDMLDHAREQICFEFADIGTDEDHEKLIAELEAINPQSPIA